MILTKLCSAEILHCYFVVSFDRNAPILSLLYGLLSSPELYETLETFRLKRPRWSTAGTFCTDVARELF